MKRQNKEEWLREAEISQRNITFLHTGENEARFWRGERRLTTVEIAGIAVIYAALVYPLWMLVGWMRHSLVSWVVLATLAIFFGLLRWRVRNALRNKLSSIAKPQPLMEGTRRQNSDSEDRLHKA
jgi:hypothetical protein